ncbi:MAG: M48 family metallopeptidase [Thermodesulfobacteriota bacterium]
MLDFFGHQEKARRNTVLLILLFGGAVAAVVAVIHLCVALLLLFSPRFAMRAASLGTLLRDPAIFQITVPATLLLIAAGTLFKLLQLRHGGPAVAARLGGRLVPPDSQTPRERQLLNVVEEMAIAAGIPVPLVYILDREGGINAFAAGFTPADAVVAVTDGALELLSRDELQGVIAHECGHILSGDSRLNLKLMGMVHGILLLHLTGAAILRGYEAGYRARRMKDEAPLIALALILYVVGFVGGVGAKLIKMAVSRQREYLSDATAVQLTRNPLGLAGALRKIGGLTTGSRLLHPRAEEASHMYFENGMGDAIFALFSSHPPLAQRIRMLDPTFDGHFPRLSPVIRQVPLEVALGEEALVEPLGGGHASPAQPPWQPVAVASATVAAVPPPSRPCHRSKGEEATDRFMRQRRRLLAKLPMAVRNACRGQEGAQAVVWNLLISQDNEDTRETQWNLVREQTARNRLLVEMTEQLSPLLGDLPREARLPLLDLCLPALRSLPADLDQEFRRTVQQLVEADTQVDLFEYAVQRILLRNLQQARHPASSDRGPSPSRQEVARASAVVLATLAHQGHDQPSEAEAALTRAVERLPMVARPLRPAAHPLSEFDQALTLLGRTQLAQRHAVVAACQECLSHDGAITLAEAELFRAIAESLSCRLPPWLMAA